MLLITSPDKALSLERFPGLSHARAISLKGQGAMTPENHLAPLWSLSDEARLAVVAIYRGIHPETDEQDEQAIYRAQTAAEIWGGPVVDLVEASFLGVVQSEANWAHEEIAALNDEPDRKIARKELADLHKHLSRAVASLSSLSLFARRRLPIEFDPIQAAADMERIVAFIDQGRTKLESSPRLQHRAERREAIACEFALRLLRAVRDYGIKPAATFERYTDEATLYESDAVKLLSLLGREIGLSLKPGTWRHHIAAATKVIRSHT